MKSRHNGGFDSSPSLWFQSNAVYNTMTGHEVGSTTENYHRLSASTGFQTTAMSSVAEPKGSYYFGSNSISLVSTINVHERSLIVFYYHFLSI